MGVAKLVHLRPIVWERAYLWTAWKAGTKRLYSQKTMIESNMTDQKKIIKGFCLLLQDLD